MKNIRKLNDVELASFFSQIAMILKAGISSTEGIEIMLKDAKTEEEKEILNTLLSSLEQTGNLHDALEASNVFEEYALQMIEIGERTGKVDDVVDNLGRYYGMEANISESIRTSLTYPFVMIVMLFLVILLLITKVLPIFNQIFHQLGLTMTGASAAILHIGEFLNSHILITFLILLVPILIFFYFMKTKKGRDTLISLVNSFGKEESLHQKICSERFANAMALTISAGLTLEEGISLSKQLIDDPKFDEKLHNLTEDLKQGEDFTTSVANHHIFTTLYTRLLTVGQRTGEIEKAMQEIAQKYEEEINEKLAQLLSTIEPTLVVILSVLVGIILLSVMLPLVSMLSMM